MSIILIITSVLLSSGSVATDPCRNAVEMPNIYIRYPGYVVDPNVEAYIDDNFLQRQWYNVGNRQLVWKFVGINKCGTKFPVFVKDNSTLPEGKEENQTVYYADLLSGIAKELPEKIKVKNCGNYRIYELTPTQHQQGYCFVPVNGSINTKETAPSEHVRTAPTVLYRIEHSAPNLFGVRVPYYAFSCVFPPVADDNLYYQVHWFINGQREHVSVSALFSNINNTDLSDNNLKFFGFIISCSVRLTKSPAGPPGRLSPRSAGLFMGIKVSPRHIRMTTSNIKNITLQFSVPFGCPIFSGQPLEECKIFIEMSTPDSGTTCRSMVSQKVVKNIEGKYCGISIGSSEWNMTHNFEISAKRTMAYAAGPDETFIVELQVGQGQIQRIWQNYQLPHVIVTLTDEPGTKWQGNSCSARCDPHITTFDGLRYDNQMEGTFVLYKNEKTGYGVMEVQITTKYCKRELVGHHVYCICGIAIRADQDVYVYDKCNRRPIMEYRTCDSDYLEVRRENDKSYQIFFPTGTYVKTMLQFNDEFLDVEVFPSKADEDNTEGLCGKINDDKSDDLIPQGSQKSIDVQTLERQDVYLRRPDNFSKSWSVPEKSRLIDMSLHQLYHYLNTNPFMVKETISLCTCTKPTDGKQHSEVNCSGDSIVQCSKEQSAKHHVKKDICNRKKQITRKRRFAHTPDNFVPFVEQSEYHLRQKRDTTFLNVTKAEAREYCNQYLTQSPAFVKCGSVPEINSDFAIDHCIADVLLTSTFDWASSAREGQKSVCMKELRQNVTLQKAERAGSPSIADVILEVACPNECSGNGICDNGQCLCNGTFGASDCSIDVTSPPVVFGINLDEGGICDTSECNAAFVIGDRFVDSDNLTCRRNHFEIDVNNTVHEIGLDDVHGDLQTITEVHCSLSDLKQKHEIAEQTRGNPFVRKMSISMSNDGVRFGDNHTLYILDSSCQDTRNVSGELRFVLKMGWCFIRGKCVGSGTHDGSNTKKVCDVSKDIFEWTVLPDPTTAPTIVSMESRTTETSTVLMVSDSTAQTESSTAFLERTDTTDQSTLDKRPSTEILSATQVNQQTEAQVSTAEWNGLSTTEEKTSIGSARKRTESKKIQMNTEESRTTDRKHSTTSSQPVSSTLNTKGDEKRSTSSQPQLWIIGAVLGGCSVVLLTVLLYCFKKRSSHSAPADPPPTYEMSLHGNAGYANQVMEEHQYDLERKEDEAFKIPRPVVLVNYDKNKQ